MKVREVIESMDSSDIYSILLFFLCVVCSAFFSSSETAYTSLKKNRLKTKAKDGDKKAEHALKLHSKYDELLATILIGNNLVNIASSAISTIFFMKLYPNYGAIISTIATTILLLLLSEIAPKLVAKMMPEKVAITFNSPLRFLIILFKPLVFLTNLWQKIIMKLIPVNEESSISEDELLSYVDEAKTEGSIEYDEHRLIKAAIEFDDVSVYSVLIPRIDVIAVDIEDTDEEIEEIFDEYSFSRLVVYEDTVDKVLGIIHEKDFYRYMRKKIRYDEDLSIESIISDVLYIPGAMKLSVLLNMMQREKKHMAVIIDEHGGMEGIVTMEDLLEELVGEIWDETDSVELGIHTVVKGKTFIASGRCALDKAFEVLNIKENEENYHSNTLGGFISENLGKMPDRNDTFIFSDYKFIVKSVEGNRVDEIIISIVE